jgi:predicted lipoprotein with Yx(FWY)xxD motif
MQRIGSTRQWAVRTATAVAVIGSVTGVSAGLVAAQAAPTAAAVTKKAVVVKVVTRHPFGKMLATTHGRSLYIKPHGGCAAACLAAWPPLFMPKGKTIPLGTHCLGTMKAGHRRQVTYRGKRLYLFVSDSGSSVTGNNVQGFKVAKISMGSCPH